LRFHPESEEFLLSGSTDGVVNILDTRIADEDEVVIQAVNHGSIHHAGFLSKEEIFALSHDEKFAVYDMTQAEGKGSPTMDFGDMRQVAGCQYVANVAPKADFSGAIVGAGSQE